MAKDDHIFTKLNKTEAIISFETLLNYKGELLLWSKGKDKKEKFRIEDFDKDSMLISMTPVLIGTELQNKNILISFESKNLQYFTSSQLYYIEEKNIYTAEVAKDVFRCDKRKDFRIESSDLSRFSISYKHYSFDGFDLSVGGASFILPADTASPFGLKQIVKDLTLKFGSTTITAPKAEVRYLLEVIDNNKGCKNLKIGFMFLETNEQFEAIIFKEINNAIYKKLNPMG